MPLCWPEGDVDLCALLRDGSPDSINSVASLLKLYLRELPEPLLTAQLQQDFAEGAPCHAVQPHRPGPPSPKAAVAGNTVAHSHCGADALARVLQSLPQPNYMLLACLMRHLAVVASHAAENKMDANNIFIVFQPTTGVNRVRRPARPIPPCPQSSRWEGSRRRAFP
jgi:hypothetical protein